MSSVAPRIVPASLLALSLVLPPSLLAPARTPAHTNAGAASAVVGHDDRRRAGCPLPLLAAGLGYARLRLRRRQSY